MLFFLVLPLCLGRQAEESNLNYSQSWVVLLENSERIYCTWHLLLAPAFNCGQTDILSSWKQRFYCLNTMCVRGERERECVHTYGWHVPNTLKLLPRIWKLYKENIHSIDLPNIDMCVCKCNVYNEKMLTKLLDWNLERSHLI